MTRFTLVRPPGTYPEQQQPPDLHPFMTGTLPWYDEFFNLAGFGGRYSSLLMPQSGQLATFLLHGP
jgi:hypothetical protein